MPNFNLTFKHKMSIKKTFDIQIPALEWLPVSEKIYKSIYIVDDNHIDIIVTQKDDKTLIFSWDSISRDINREIRSHIRKSFVFFMDQIDVGTDTNLEILRRYYNDVCYLQADPFRALIVTILSQNKTGEMTRKAFFNLLKILKNFSPYGILQLGEDRLKDAIRIGGPYKAKYIIESCNMIINDWKGNLNDVIKLPTNDALEALTRLPGVAHKTAACVLVYAGLKNDILPIDTHLWRVVQRLGLVTIKNKTLSSAVRQQMITQLQSCIPDAGYAHLFFVMLGREFCFAKNPLCVNCPLQITCPWRKIT